MKVTEGRCGQVRATEGQHDTWINWIQLKPFELLGGGDLAVDAPRDRAGALFEKLDSHWRIARCHAEKKCQRMR